MSKKLPQQSGGAEEKTSGKQTVAVQIAGRDYKIRTDSSEASLRKIAGYVDRAMHRIEATTGTVDTADVAMLTCLNLARQLLAMHEEREGLRGGAEAASGGASELRMRELIERVEEVRMAHSARVETNRENAVQAGSAAAESAQRIAAGLAAKPSVGTPVAPPGPDQHQQQGASAEASANVAGSTPDHAQAKTLELPSPEVLRERAAAEASRAESLSSSDGEPEVKRAAGGGRDLAS